MRSLITEMQSFIAERALTERLLSENLGNLSFLTFLGNDLMGPFITAMKGGKIGRDSETFDRYDGSFSAMRDFKDALGAVIYLNGVAIISGAKTGYYEKRYESNGNLCVNFENVLKACGGRKTFPYTVDAKELGRYNEEWQKANYAFNSMFNIYEKDTGKFVGGMSASGPRVTFDNLGMGYMISFGDRLQGVHGKRVKSTDLSKDMVDIAQRINKVLKFANKFLKGADFQLKWSMSLVKADAKRLDKQKLRQDAQRDLIPLPGSPAYKQFIDNAKYQLKGRLSLLNAKKAASDAGLQFTPKDITSDKFANEILKHIMKGGKAVKIGEYVYDLKSVQHSTGWGHKDFAEGRMNVRYSVDFDLNAGSRKKYEETRDAIWATAKRAGNPGGDKEAADVYAEFKTENFDSLRFYLYVSVGLDGSMDVKVEEVRKW